MRLPLLLLLAACGEGGSEAEAARKCHDWAVLVCARAVECQAAPDARTCTDQLAGSLVCGKTRSVSPLYDDCLSDTKSARCTALFPGGVRKNPASCENVFLQPRQSS